MQLVGRKKKRKKMSKRKVFLCYKCRNVNQLIKCKASSLSLRAAPVFGGLSKVESIVRYL